MYAFDKLGELNMSKEVAMVGDVSRVGKKLMRTQSSIHPVALYLSPPLILSLPLVILGLFCVGVGEEGPRVGEEEEG